MYTNKPACDIVEPLLASNKHQFRGTGTGSNPNVIIAIGNRWLGFNLDSVLNRCIRIDDFVSVDLNHRGPPKSMLLSDIVLVFQFLCLARNATSPIVTELMNIGVCD
jgi:hypothetical protein